MKDQSRWLRGFELRRMLLTAIRERVHVALAEPILRIGAARQARPWLKKDSETIPPPCLNVPHACWYGLERWRQRAKAQLRSEPLCALCLAMGVRRDKAALSSGCKSHPATA